MTHTMEVDPSDFSHRRLFGPSFVVADNSSDARWVVRPARFTTSTLAIQRIADSGEYGEDIPADAGVVNGTSSAAGAPAHPRISAVRRSRSSRSLRVDGEEIARVNISGGAIQVTTNSSGYSTDKATTVTHQLPAEKLDEDVAAAAFACWVVDWPRNPSKIRF